MWPALQGWAELRGVSPGEHSELIKVFSDDIRDFLLEESSQTPTRPLSMQETDTDSTHIGVVYFYIGVNSCMYYG